MYFKFLTFVGLVFLLAEIYPALGKETNASRLKRGLPPLPPRFLKRATASGTTTARPSHSPRPQLYGRSSRIQVFAGNGSSLGYVRNSTPIISINLDADPGQDLRIQAVTSGEPFEIAVEPNSLSAPIYSGAFSSSLAFRDLPGVSNVNQARPATISDKASMRSAVWSVDSKTKELKARYADPTRTKNFLHIAFDPHRNALEFVGDIDIYNAVNDDFPVIPVRLYLSED